MKATLRFLLPLLTGAVLGLPSLASRPAENPNPSKYFVLDNGLQVVLFEKHGTPLVNICLAVAVGSKDESPGSHGLAHLLEHCLLFRGSGGPDEEAKIGAIRRNGAYFNGTTNQDLTQFDVSLPAVRADFGLSTIKALFSDLDVVPGGLDREKDVILEEIGTFRDDPRRLAASLVYENLFPGHPYSNPLFGDQESISKAAIEDLISLHKTYYVPANCSLAVVGDFALAEMEPRVRAAFEGLRGSPSPHVPAPKAKLLEKDVEIRREMDVKEAYLAIGLVGPDTNNPDQFPADVLTEILGRGFNPMLNIALRARREISKSVSMSFAPLESGGVFIVLITLDPGDVSQARTEALAFLKKVRTLNFGKEDYYGDEQVYAFDFLRGAKNQIRFAAQRGRESGLNLAASFARHALLAEKRNETESFLTRIERVTSSDLRKIATRYFNQGESVAVAIVPRKVS
jgi:zinc protease